MLKWLTLLIFFGQQFTAWAIDNRSMRLSLEHMFGPNKASDTTIGLSYQMIDSMDVFIDYYNFQKNGTESGILLGADYSLGVDELLSANVHYSKDQDGVAGKGFDLASNFTFAGLFADDLSTDFNIALGTTHYSKEETLSNTTTSTDYRQYKVSAGLDQELSSDFSFSIGASKYLYSDSSEVSTRLSRNRVNTYSFSAIDGLAKDRFDISLFYYFNNQIALSNRLSLTQYADLNNSYEDDFSLIYKIKNMKFALRYKWIRSTLGEIEHWFGPKVSYKF